MKKCMLGLLLVVAMVAVVSCSQNSLAQDDLVSVRFSKLEARAIDNDTCSVTGDATWGGANVKIGGVEDYWWTYTATKNDDGFKSGEQTTFANWSDEKGLSGSRTFSAGSWKFELKAYASEDDRTEGTKAVFTGEATTGKLTSSTTISVPMSFTYVEGTGSADFEIFTTISQPEGETYAITKVEMIIGEETVNLTEGDSSWSGSVSGVASGRQKVGIKVYVDDETEARVFEEIGSAYIMHGMTTNISGSATVTIAGDKTVDVTLSPTIPSSVPVRAPEGTAVGDTLTLGKLPDSETAVSWKVLKIENRKALVISEKALVLMAHTDNETDTYSWANSKINSWLNDARDNGFVSQYGLSNVSIATGESEIGNIFLLSSDEATNYNCTAGVVFVGDNQEYGCWLRDAAAEATMAKQIMPSALQVVQVFSDTAAKEKLGVRPAFWIDIE